jgi:DNA polymerase III subunit chi
MSRVDFYLLPDMDGLARRRFACRLAFKACARGERVHVHVDDSAQAADLDELMWQYPAEFFIPHELGANPADGRAGATANAVATLAPVTIDHRARHEPSDALLINLSSTVPPFASSFARIAEIVIEADRADGRVRYRHYRHDGHPLFHHALEDWER